MNHNGPTNCMIFNLIQNEDPNNTIHIKLGAKQFDVLVSDVTVDMCQGASLDLTHNPWNLTIRTESL